MKSKSENFREIPNLYSPYEIDSGNWFYHEDLIRRIKQEFESENILLILGYRGSGKTSTLRRIVENPTILGMNYLPIYLNCGRIIPADLGAFLVAVYKEIKKNLTKFDIHLDKPDFSLRTSISVTEIDRFIQKINSILPKEQTMVLIFDDLEELLDAEDDETLKTIATFFENTVFKHARFKLILAGRGEKFELDNLRGMAHIVDAACRLELGKFLDKSEIVNLIVRPVENFLEYEQAAIQEIIRITGGTIYLQKLLCYYLINYLNQVERNVCTADDVWEAVKLTLKDKREDFEYFWSNLPPEGQLCAAALADDSITKAKGHYFFLEESPLLDAIFDEASLNKILNRMIQDHFINQIQGRRFESYPSKIPLYGYWIAENHSFLETTIDNWQWISRQIPLDRLGQILKLIPTEKLSLEQEIIETTSRLSDMWARLQSNFSLRKIDRQQIESLVDLFCQILSFEVKNRPEDRRTFFTINMNSLNLNGLDEVLLFMPSREELSDLDIQYYQDEILRQDRPATASFIICVKKSEKIQELMQKRFLGIVLIEEDSLKRLALSTRPIQVFKNEILLKQVKPSLISNYKTEGPVTITFFGRQDEIGRIIQTRERNFAIVGSRKIGKTSLLFKVKENLPSTTAPIYMDLEAPLKQNYQTFLALLTDELQQLYSWLTDVPANLDGLRQIIRQFTQQTQKMPFFILDEIDTLLEYDVAHDYELIKTFRALSHENRCQVIFSGYEVLFHETYRLNSPFYNFCQIIQLDRLKEKDALDLITSPMESIGIKYQNPEDRRLILQQSSCHPNLLQFICKQLVEKIDEHDTEEERRMIFREDIEEMLQSYEYENYIIHDFYSFLTADINPIEKLIVLLPLAAEPSLEEFTSSDLKKLFNELNFGLSTGELTQHLANLKLRYFLNEKRGGKFHFALPLFPEILKRRKTIGDLIQEVKQDAYKSI